MIPRFSFERTDRDWDRAVPSETPKSATPPTTFTEPTTPTTPTKMLTGTKPQSTPIARNETRFQPFTSTHQYRNSAFRMVADETSGKFYKMDGDAFIQKFFPDVPGTPRMPEVDHARLKEIVAAAGKESDIYGPFNAAMTCFVKVGWRLVNTSSKRDNNTRHVWFDRAIGPDTALYAPNTILDPRKMCLASKMELIGEWKWNPGDEPFDDDAQEEEEEEQTGVPNIDDGPSPPKRQKLNDSFERSGEQPADTRGQIIFYLNSIQALQYRTRVFSFYARSQYCRLICHSRSETIVTPLIDFTKTDTLHKFLWRYTHSGPAERGHDTTFRPVFIGDPDADVEDDKVVVGDTNESNEENKSAEFDEEDGDEMAKVDDVEVAAARKALQLAETDPLFQVSVPASKQASESSSDVASETNAGDQLYFYVSQPFTQTHCYPLGRGTRCFLAYAPVSASVVLLKDCWRIAAYTLEGDIYANLRQRLDGKPDLYIPTVVTHGEIDGPLQRSGYDVPNSSIQKLHHYRIVLKEVGRLLQHSTSTHELVTATLDAFRLHRAASDAGILHRDISIGNIVILYGHGFLIDWEMARLQGQTDARARERTGTWQFLSVRLLSEPSAFHEASDDIESFILVLLWLAARHARNNMTAQGRTQFLQQFDRQVIDPVVAKRSMIAGGASLLTEALETKPLADLLEALVESLVYRYDAEKRFAERERRRGLELSDDTASEWHKRLFTHEWMEGQLQEALRDETWKEIKDDHKKSHEQPLVEGRRDLNQERVEKTNLTVFASQSRLNKRRESG